MKIFIGSLSYNVTEGDLRQTFEAFGQVASATVIKDYSGPQCQDSFPFNLSVIFYCCTYS